MKQIELKEVTELAPPLCQFCGRVMRLIGSETHPVEAETDLLTYCCTACDTFLVESAKHTTEASSSSEAPWLKLVESHDFSEPINQTLKASQTFPKHPVCPCCDVPMWLSKVTKTEKVEYFYECKVCEEKMSVTDRNSNASQAF